MASQGYNIPFLDMTSGKICLSGDKGEELDFRLVRNLLVNFGEIYSLDTAERERGKIVVCEYYDRRRSIDVIESMHGRDMFVFLPYVCIADDRVFGWRFGMMFLTLYCICEFIAHMSLWNLVRINVCIHLC